VVNFHGVVLLDEFVRQRERVVDYRTEYSGVRPGDLIIRGSCRFFLFLFANPTDVVWNG
jgi:hypothetical protein